MDYELLVLRMVEELDKTETRIENMEFYCESTRKTHIITIVYEKQWVIYRERDVPIAVRCKDCGACKDFYRACPLRLKDFKQKRFP